MPQRTQTSIVQGSYPLNTSERKLVVDLDLQTKLILNNQRVQARLQSLLTQNDYESFKQALSIVGGMANVILDLEDQ